MTTRADLRTILRNQGLDESTWSDTELNQWIADAIGEYSWHFPRYVENTGNACGEGEHAYALPSGCLGVLRVEYPEGEDPPRYLQRLDPRDNRWGPGAYAIRWGGFPSASAVLVLGDAPSAGETYALHYFAAHDYPDDDVTPLTVPDEDLELLVLYVLWKAYRRLELDEAKNPDGSTVILSMLGASAARAYREYEAALRARERAGGEAVSWG
ncbi:MAG: phage adaptor protein [Anaerolineae bacterium]